ncbi:hypothetical protein [Catelliglobosispora koreensis]|uniref:hypothetical protein n=1 Tax=Catelliglobosispora koreensis TaxID=129052 RepID=UPI0012FB5969|nr:hypothetical protein [Catelliglobosispora koreensis]
MRFRKSTWAGIASVAFIGVGLLYVAGRDTLLIVEGFHYLGPQNAWPPTAAGLLLAIATGMAFVVLFRRWSRMTIARRRKAAAVIALWVVLFALTYVGTHGARRRSFTLWEGVDQVSSGWEIFLLSYQVPVAVTAISGGLLLS